MKMEKILFNNSNCKCECEKKLLEIWKFIKWLNKKIHKEIEKIKKGGNK